MCPSQSRLALLLGLMFLAGVAGCEQASSNNVSSLEPRPNVSESPLSKQGPTRQQPIDSGHPDGEPRAPCLGK